MSTPRFTNTECLVLKQSPIGEADRVLTLLTDTHGKLRAVARGIRRPKSRMAGSLEPLMYSRLMLARGRAMPVVAGVETIRSFSKLRTSLEATARALICAELADAFSPEEQANPSVLALLLEALEWFDAGEGDRVLRYFEFQLLQRSGYMPELQHCVTCRTAVVPDQHAFSPALGGVVCLACVGAGMPGAPAGRGEAPVLALSVNGLKVLRYFHGHTYGEVRSLQLKPPLARELESLLGSYILYLLERKQKAPAFLEALRRTGTA